MTGSIKSRANICDDHRKALFTGSILLPLPQQTISTWAVLRWYVHKPKQWFKSERGKRLRAKFVIWEAKKPLDRWVAKIFIEIFVDLEALQYQFLTRFHKVNVKIRFPFVRYPNHLNQLHVFGARAAGTWIWIKPWKNVLVREHYISDIQKNREGRVLLTYGLHQIGCWKWMVHLATCNARL